VGFFSDFVSISSVPCLACFSRYWTIFLLLLRWPLDALWFAGTRFKESIRILNLLVSKPKTILFHLRYQVNQLDYRVLSAHAQALDKILLLTRLVIFVSQIPLFSSKLSYLLNSLLDFLSPKDAANAPPVREGCQQNSFLLQLPSDRQCN